jgi:hypothetical protein
MTTPREPTTRNADVARPHLPDAPDRLAPAECGAEKLDGTRCTLKPVLGLSRCYSHAPELAEERHAARVKGGLIATRQRTLAPADAPPVSLATAADARHLVEDTIQHVRTGQLAPNAANSVFYGISVALRLAELELSAQVAALEQELAERKRPQR